MPPFVMIVIHNKSQCIFESLLITEKISRHSSQYRVESRINRDKKKTKLYIYGYNSEMISCNSRTDLPINPDFITDNAISAAAAGL